MDAVKRGKFERTTQEQLQYFVTFCKEHPELQRGKFQANNPKMLQNLWTEVTDTLNAMRGPTRTAAKWKEGMMHWKHQLRSRARKLKAQSQMTGGGPLVADISEFEQQAIDTFGAAAVDGIPDVGTLGLEAVPSLSIIVDDNFPLTPSPSTAAVSSPMDESPSATSSCFVFPAAASPCLIASNAVMSASVSSDAATSAKHPSEIASHIVLNAAMTPVVSSPTAERKMTAATVLSTVMSKLEAREKREDQAILQQEQIISQNKNIASALIQLSQALNSISQVLNKLCDKIDKL